MKERFVNETKLPTESLSKSMGTSEKMSEIENLNSELLISSAQCGGQKQMMILKRSLSTRIV